jgi:hypothetical protein
MSLFASGLKESKSNHSWLRIHRAVIRGLPYFTEAWEINLDHGRPVAGGTRSAAR